MAGVAVLGAGAGDGAIAVWWELHAVSARLATPPARMKRTATAVEAF
jgi:hypothetical protein